MLNVYQNLDICMGFDVLGLLDKLIIVNHEPGYKYELKKKHEYFSVLF